MIEGETPEKVYGRLFPGTADRPRVLAVIWATVDRDRLLVESEWSAAEILADDPHLGASVALVVPAVGDPIAILEPLTEGRLAATLARHGEGPAGEYVESPVDLVAIGPSATAAGLSLGRPAAGPFGRSVLVLSSLVSGPHLVLVERPAGTIAR